MLIPFIAQVPILMAPLQYLFPTTIVVFSLAFLTAHSLGSALTLQLLQFFGSHPSDVDPLHRPSITTILNASATNAMARALFAFVCWQDVIN